VIAMRGIDVYLEAPSRTQELLNIKWTLKAAGFRIGSTWHEDLATTSAPSSKDHCHAKGVEELQACDSLVVICGKDGRVEPSMALMAGLALARRLQVVWIGPSFGGLDVFGAVRRFSTAEDYAKEILSERYSNPASNDTARVAA